MKNDNRKLLVIGAGVLQMPAIRQALKMGLTVLASDMDPVAPGVSYAHGHDIVSTLDAAGNVEYAKREGVNGVLTLATDMPLVTVAAVAHALDLCAVSPAVAERATNKYKMKQAFAKNGVPCPKFEITATVAQAERAAQEIGYPVVTKPLKGSGSRGVHLLRTASDIAPAFAEAQQVAKRQQVVIEEYAQGRHICVEAFTWKKQTRVLCVIDRIVSRPPNFVELRHTFPSSLNKKTLKTIEDLTIAGIDALGIEAGPSHTDMIVTNRGPVLSEIGARLDGDYKSSHFMPLVFGYNIIADTIRAAMGETPLLFAKNLDLTPRCALCIWYFTPKPGRVKTVSGAAAARRSPGVKYFELNIKPGKDIVPFTRSHDRVGVVIAVGATRAEAVKNAQNVENVIHLEYV
jgi:biotin carboxylase